MADFKKAYKKIMLIEGGYVNDKQDLGGETYKGVSRKYNPDWNGWELVDFYKGRSDFPKILDLDESLKDRVKSLYKKLYWDKFQGDKIQYQNITNKMFDISVNIGVNRAVKFLQIALNALNNSRDIDLLEEDSKFGNKTNIALIYWADKYCLDILKMLNLQQGNHYMNRVKEDSTQKRFIRGWLSRVNL